MNQFTDELPRGDARPPLMSPARIIMGVAVLFGLHLWLSYPGVMTYDSKVQYGQALAGKFGDWHPPIMAWLWHLLLPISVAGAGMLVFHLALYWLGVGAIAVAFARGGKPTLAFVSILVGMAPHLALLSTFIHKDVGFAVALMASFGLVLLTRAGGGRLTWGVGLLVALTLPYATLVRTNAIFGAAPIALYAWFPRRDEGFRRLAISLGLSLILVVIVIPASWAINKYAFAAIEEKPMGSIALFDISGTAHFARDPTVFPVVVPTMAEIDRCYDPFLWDSLVDGACMHTVGFKNGVKTAVKAKALPRAVLRHPLAYAEHRLLHFNEELFALSRARHWQWGVFPGYNDLPPGRIEPFTYQAIDIFGNVPPVVPATSFILTLAALSLVAFRRVRLNIWQEGAYYLSLSATLYTLGFAVIGVASMYRYQQFLMTAAPIAAMLVWAGHDVGDRRRVVLTLAIPTGVMMVLILAARLWPASA